MTESRDRRVLVALPAFNEEDTIGDVIQEIRETFPTGTIIVVDDGSSDATLSIARNLGVITLSLPFNVGVGGAMRAAFLYALRNGFDVVVQVDADGQHDPRFITSLVEQTKSYDIVIGSRFHAGGKYRVRGPRKWAMNLLAFSLSHIAATPLTDTTSGFRASGPRAVSLFAKHYPAEYLGDTVDSLVIAVRQGLSVAEFPVDMRQRQGGEPSQNFIRSTLYFTRASIALLTALLRPSDSTVQGG